MAKYSVGTIRKKALKAGYKVSKGYQHYMYNGAVVKDCNGEPYDGYNVEDLTTGTLVWGCYDSNYDHLWGLDEVEEFLEKAYRDKDLKY